MAVTNRSLFVNPGLFPPNIVTTTPSTNTSPAFVYGPQAGGNSMIKEIARTGARYAGNRVMQHFAENPNAAGDIARNVGQRISNAAANRMNANGGPPPQGFGSEHSHSSGYSLTKAPNPKKVSLDTGIKPNTYTSDYMQAIENECSPLHVSLCSFKIPTYASSALYNYFLNVIAFDLQTRAQGNVTFNLDLTNDFSATNILTAMNDACYAFQIYFYHMSIVSYHSDPRNKNEGMIYLRNQFTPTLIENLTLLGRRLADTPIPPKMLEMLRYTYANFYSGEMQGSPLIKFCPLAGSSTLTDASTISTALTNLSTPANIKVFTLLRRAVPQWTPGIIYDVEPTPFYDANFKTMFANAPFIYYNGTTTVRGPATATETSTFFYNSFTEALDGAAFSATSAYNAATSSWLPGLMLPIGSGALNGVTRLSYYSVSGVGAFYSVGAYPFLSRARQETYAINDANNATIGLHLFGADKCQTVSPATIKETCFNVLDYLMSSETIPNQDHRKVVAEVNMERTRMRRPKAKMSSKNKKSK